MRREFVFVLFILLLMLIFAEAKALATKSVLTQCSENITEVEDCLKNEKSENLTQVTGVIDSVKCVEETIGFQRFQIHLVPQKKLELLSEAKMPNDISFIIFKSDAKKNYQKSVYFIKGETPTLWLMRSESLWKIAQVKWFEKDIQSHLKGPPSCNL